MVDIHDRMLLVLKPGSVEEWLSPDTTAERAAEMLHDGSYTAEDYRWHAVSSAVSNNKNQGADMIQPTR